MPSFAELKGKAASLKNNTTEKIGNTKDKYSSVSTAKLDLEERQKRPPPPPVPVKKKVTAPPPVRTSSKPSGVASPTPSISPPPSAGHASPAFLHRTQLLANPPPLVKYSSRPDAPPKPISRVPRPESTREDQHEGGSSALPDHIDWANLSAEDKAIFFSWLDEFFSVYLKTGKPPVVEQPDLPVKPSLPARKSTTEAAPVTKSHFGSKVAEIQAKERPTLPNHAESAPPLPGNRPAIPMVSRPVEPALVAAEVEECMYCRDFSTVDAHAANFPREHVHSVQMLAHDLTDPFPYPTDKARAIFTWLHHNIAYDAENFLAGTVKGSTPDGTLRSGKAVCEGYAGLFANLAIQAGLECIVVSGHGKGWGYTPPSGAISPYNGNHAWNAVRLGDGEWKLIDSCWGAGALLPSGEYHKRFDPDHFAASNGEFGRRHFPDPKEPWKQYVEQPLTWEEYMKTPERPRIMGHFTNLGYAPHLLYPDTLKIAPGQQTFYCKLGCEHVLETEADAYVPIMLCQGQANMDSLKHDPVNGGWSITINVTSGETVRLAYVSELSGRDALGVGRAAYEAARGRQAMQFQYLVEWEVE